MQLPGSYHISQYFRNPDCALQPLVRSQFQCYYDCLKTKKTKKTALALTVSAITTHI